MIKKISTRNGKIINANEQEKYMGQRGIILPKCVNLFFIIKKGN